MLKDLFILRLKGTGFFHEKDRKIIHTVCSVFLAIIFAFWGIKAIGFAFRDRELTMENYGQYVKIYPSIGGNSTPSGYVSNYGFSFECKKRTISDLQVELIVIFSDYKSKEVLFEKTEIIDFDKLEKGRMCYREVLSVENLSYDLTYTLVSISGEVA